MNAVVKPKIVTQSNNPHWSRPARQTTHNAITLRLRYDNPEQATAASLALAALVSATPELVEGPKPFVLTTGSEIIAAFVLKDASPNLDQLARTLATTLQAHGVQNASASASRVLTSNTAEVAQMWVALRALTQPEAYARKER